MAYTPINWQTGDTITADKMNKMDNGWSVSSTQLFSESVTTADNSGMIKGLLVYSDAIDADSIVVTFNGTGYTCSRLDVFNAHFYGGFSESGPVFSEYPFAIQSTDGKNCLYTQTAGTYTISATASTAEVSSNFVLASKTATTDLIQSVSPFFFTLYSTTWQEVYDAMLANRLCVRSANDGEKIDIYIAVTANPTDYSVIVMNPLQGGGFVRYEASSADDPLSD